jgi:hypothetical protein
MEDFNSRPSVLGPFILGLSLSVDNEEQQRAIWNNISNFYFKNEQINPINEEQVKDFVHVSVFKYFYNDTMYFEVPYNEQLFC